MTISLGNTENSSEASDSSSEGLLSDNELGSYDDINDNMSNSSDDAINSEIDDTFNFHWAKNKSGCHH